MTKRKLWLIPAISIPIVLFTILAVVVFSQFRAKGEAPLIELEIYDGPNYSESDNMCYYRIEAVVSGSPEPEVTFADDDNVRQLGSGRAEVAVEEGKSYSLTATASNPSGTATATITLSGECGEDTLVEEAEEEVTDEEEETTETEETEEGVPTIAMEIYEGPAPADGLCFYRVRAIVTGTPAPTVTWSKDDSHGAWGTRRVQVNLGSPDETYTLTATATNSKGTATESITLSWGCPIPASDPPVTVKLWPSSWGVVNSAGIVPIYLIGVGDMEGNRGVQAFLTFDLSSIPLTANIVSGQIEIVTHHITGDPFGSLGPLRVYLHNYGTLDPGDYTPPPVVGAIASFSNEAQLSDPAVQKLNDRGVSGIQDALAGSQFQIRLQFSDRESDNDNVPDLVFLEFMLVVSYRP